MGKNERVPAGTVPRTRRAGEPLFMERHKTGVVRIGTCLLAAGGVANHSHLLIALPVGVAPAKAIQVLKANSSRWIHEHGIAFAWQVGYGAFSVSSSNKTAVKDYIEHQAEHHRGRSYEAEFEAMIRKSGMRFDPEDAFG